MDNKKIWSAQLVNGKMLLLNGERMPRKTKKYIKGLLTLFSPKYMAMSMSLSKEYDGILFKLKETDGTTAI